MGTQKHDIPLNGLDTRSIQPMHMSLEETRHWALVGMFSAFALVMSYAETFIPIPIPVPGVKLGLANAVVLAALLIMDLRSALCIALIKVLAAGFLFGSPVMIAYSAAGTLMATLAMGLTVRLPGVGTVPAAIVGAIFHNIGQLLVANVLLGTTLVWFSAPVLFVAACITGVITGLLAKYLVDASEEELP